MALGDDHEEHSPGFRLQIWPKSTGRPPVPPEVPSDIAQDYIEAAIVLKDSPKASAALSRRCLQHVLRTAANAGQHDLAKQIDHVLSNGQLPAQLRESIDAIRNIGNFAAHPMKSTKSGEILDVELGEADWSLDVLEALFDFYYVQPAKLAVKKHKLNEKLSKGGKPPMK